MIKDYIMDKYCTFKKTICGPKRTYSLKFVPQLKMLPYLVLNLTFFFKLVAHSLKIKVEPEGFVSIWSKKVCFYSILDNQLYWMVFDSRKLSLLLRLRMALRFLIMMEPFGFVTSSWSCSFSYSCSFLFSLPSFYYWWQIKLHW